MPVLTKETLRAEMRQKRDYMNALEAVEQSKIICEKVAGLGEFKTAQTIAFYVPITALDDHIEFVEFTTFDDLKPAKFGILEPETKTKPNREPDVVIVPGLAFDSDLHRLGYGKGYYDKLFARLKTFKIGVCFDFQLVEKIPRHEHDVRLDLVVSEKRVLKPVLGV